MRGAWDEGEEGNYLCLKVILKFSTYFLFFKTKALHVVGWRVGEPRSVGNESDSHKMCFSEPRGLFYILWHEDTERKPPPGPWRAPCSPVRALGIAHIPALSSGPPRGEEGYCCLPRPRFSPPRPLPSSFSTSPPILLGKNEAMKGWPHGGSQLHHLQSANLGKIQRPQGASYP